VADDGTTAQHDGGRGEVFLVPAAMRQSADELGPRAHRTIARILDAARQIFLTNGYSGTTIDDIARVAEMSRASIYTYFPSKRDIMLAAGARSASEGEQVIDRAVDDPAALGLALSSMFERSWSYDALYGSAMGAERLHIAIGQVIWSIVQGLDTATPSV
jgi:AcrR family transcriptional regulator